MGACASKSPVLGGEEQQLPVIQGKELLSSPKHISQPALEKQDSAYLERTALTTGSPPDVDTDDYQGKISAQFSVQDSAEGKAASLRKFGPPKPMCNTARLDNIKELGLWDRPSGDPQIQHIMELMCTVFSTKSALVSLVGDDTIWVHDAINFQKGDFAWRTSLCAHTLTPANHQVMVVEDTQQDQRFAHLPLVRAEKVRFYAGTPIVSSRGHRLGTVCFACDQPRKFDAESCMMLNNMGELVTRELERDWATQLQSKEITSNTQETPLIRTLECFNEAVMFIDVSVPKWRILHLNGVAQTKLKLYDVEVPQGSDQDGSLLWEVFRPNSNTAGVNPEAPWESFAEDIRHGRKFEVTSTRFNGNHSHNSAPSPLFSLTFRSAANDVIDSNAPLVGAPAYMPMTESNYQYYFVTLSHSHSSHSRSTISSTGSVISGPLDPEAVPFENLELGPLLGKGGYGRVYRGIRNDEVLAVKIIDNSATIRMMDGEPLEAAITKGAHHPNVVRTIDFAVTSASAADADSDSGAALERFDSATSHHKQRQGDSETWMLLEFCDCGSLQEASDKGFFRPEGRPNMAAILNLAAQVADGMAFLHARGVAHGDLTGGNVLLASDPASPAGVRAKIADFGLARSLGVQSKIETHTYGTVTHMPPELLTKGVFSKPADPFALGVLMWEMYHGVRAWSSMNQAQIITAVAVNGRTLEFLPGAPPGYVQLATALMHQDPQQRPTFEQALATIRRMEAALE